MNKIVLEIDGVRHRLVYDPNTFDCRDCSIKGGEYCQNNLCINLTKDIRYHFIKEEDLHPQPKSQKTRTTLVDLISELNSKEVEISEVSSLNLVIRDIDSNISTTYTLDEEGYIQIL